MAPDQFQELDVGWYWNLVALGCPSNAPGSKPRMVSGRRVWPARNSRVWLVHGTQAEMVACDRRLHCQFVRRYHPRTYRHSMGVFNTNSHRGLHPMVDLLPICSEESSVCGILAWHGEGRATRRGQVLHVRNAIPARLD